MTRIDVPPTRSNLLRMKQELQFSREGYEILDKKREVLTAELIRIFVSVSEGLNAISLTAIP